MFKDALSDAVLHLCETYKLSCEAAAKRCGISPGYYICIADKKASPSILTLEKLCNGFQLTPNDLLVPQILRRQMGFRLPMPVTRVRLHRYHSSSAAYPVCPRCEMSLEREYQGYCDRCGQQLHWNDYSNAAIILPGEG